MGTSLQQFLSKFSSTEGKHVNLINPLATFDAKIKFYPDIDVTKNDSNGIMGKIGSALKKSANDLVNNATGGLAASILNRKHSTMTIHNEWEWRRKKSFINMLAEANLIVGGNSIFGPEDIPMPLEISLGYYVQSAVIPRIGMVDGGKMTSILGEFPANGLYIKPDNNQLQMEVLCTKLPLHERLFYPWMKEVTLPYWSYDTQPYTTAKITIDFSKHTDLKYVFYGCRPSQIDLIQPTQQPDGQVVRQVTFIFDVMAIQSNKLKSIDDPKHLLGDTAKTLLNGSARMLNA